MSTRMGQDKGKMLVNDRPMILNILETLDEHVQEVVLVLRDEKQAQIYKKIIDDHHSKDFSFNLIIANDEIKDHGPLIGIYTGLKQVREKYALILPCDSPLISALFIENIFKILEETKEKYDALVPQWNSGNIEPLHSIYHKKSIALIELLFLEGKKDVKSLTKQLNVHFIEVEKLDPSKRSFMNFNTPEDIEKI